MIAVADIDADLEVVFANLEADGKDMTKMRAAAASVAALEVGIDTPPPRSRLRPAMLPDPGVVIVAEPLHEGLNETPESKFYERHTSGLILPTESTYPGQRQHIRLTKRVDRVIRSNILHWMCFISLLVVLVLKW